ncbi:MAG: hypothetical protein IKN56_03720 [Clostridia bacterium]|nr:hypothetical protein [Clostridia bacterium]MBR6360659.1 hypothetical protein [Clostridia bacterium]
MKSRIAAAAAVILMLLALASCGLPKITGDFDFGKNRTDAQASSLTQESESETKTESKEETEKASQSESAGPGVTEKDVSAAKTTAGGVSEIIETATTALRTTSEKITTEITKYSRTSRTTTTRPPRTTTTRATTTTTRASTTAKTTSASGDFGGYTGRVVTENKTYTSDLKYGVDLHRHVTIYYGFNSQGKKYVLKEEETGRTYDRTTYTATYNQLLPAAQKNRQTYAAYISEVLRLTNQMRAERGLRPLQLSEKLCTQANVRAEEVAWSGKHSHIRPNLKSYTSIFRENGISTGLAGENLGWYYTSAADVCAAWKASQTHYENIMNPDFKYIGIGVAAEADPTKNLCWVQHFTD